MSEQVSLLLKIAYRACAWLAAACIAAILLLVILNIIDRVFGGYTPGTNEFASYCVGAAGALGLAYTFGENRHIRMTLLIGRTHGLTRQLVEVVSLLIAISISGFICFFIVRMVFVSMELGDRSTGTDALPLWIPQLPMAFGFFVFAVSLIHELTRTVTKWNK